MIAVFKRELRSYFTTPIGYIFMAVFLAVSGVIFCLTTLFQMTSAVTEYFTYMMIALAVLLPVLTMKSFSEERKQRTEQLLLTAPLSLWSMVLGKFLASLLLYGGCMIFSSLYFLILTVYGKVKFGMLAGNLVAILLVGGVFIAIGIFVSSLTENQLASAIGTVGIIALFLAVSLLNSLIQSMWLRNVLSAVSLFTRFQSFAQGAFDPIALLYYISLCALFLFFTVRVFARRRYK